MIRKIKVQKVFWGGSDYEYTMGGVAGGWEIPNRQIAAGPARSLCSAGSWHSGQVPRRGHYGP